MQHIFAKYCTPPPGPAQSPSGTDGAGRTVLLIPPPNAYISSEGLDAWACDTNGAPFTQETKDELVEFLDVTDDGGLTCVYVWFSFLNPRTDMFCLALLFVLLWASTKSPTVNYDVAR